jgi:NitT/TauT family transport system substrate-binding protein
MTANPFSRRTFLGGTAAGAGLLLGGSSLITACSGSSEPPAAAPLTSVNFQLSWFDSVQFGGSYIADERGYYERYGLDVTLTPGGFDAPVDPPVIAGQAIMGISAADYAGRSVNEGAPFKIVGVAMQRNPFVIASLTSNPINEPKDLEGRKLGMAFNNQLDLDLLASLNGVDLSRVEVIQSDYDPAPLVNGEVDSLLCWLVDLPVAMTVAGIDNTTMLFADFGYAVHSQTYIVTDDTLANNRDAALGMLRGEILGWQDHKADPDTAAQVTVDRFPDAGMDLETETIKASEFVKLMFSDVTDASGFLWWTDQSVADNIRVLSALGVNVTEELWDRSLLEEIYADGPVLS